MPLEPPKLRPTHVKIDCRFSERVPVAELSPLARLCFLELIQYCVRQDKIFIPYRKASAIADELTAYYGHDLRGELVITDDILDELLASCLIRSVIRETQPLRIELTRSDWDFGYSEVPF